MTNTKKDFIAIAKIINKRISAHRFNNPNKVLMGEHIAKDLSDYFETRNPKFNKQLFLNACLKENG